MLAQPGSLERHRDWSAMCCTRARSASANGPARPQRRRASRLPGPRPGTGRSAATARSRAGPAQGRRLALRAGCRGEEGAQVGQIRLVSAAAGCCPDGAMFGSGSYPQLAVLVSDQRIHGIGRHLRTGQLDRMTEQFVISALEPVAPFACRGRGGFAGREVRSAARLRSGPRRRPGRRRGPCRAGRPTRAGTRPSWRSAHRSRPTTTRAPRAAAARGHRAGRLRQSRSAGRGSSGPDAGPEPTPPRRRRRACRSTGCWVPACTRALVTSSLVRSTASATRSSWPDRSQEFSVSRTKRRAAATAVGSGSKAAAATRASCPSMCLNLRGPWALGAIDAGR